MGRRLLRVLVITVLAIPLLVLAVLVFLTLPPGEELVRSILASQLSKQLHQPVHLGSFETNLVSRVRLDSLTIESARGTAQRPVLRLRAIEIHYDLAGLLHHEAHVTSFLLDTTRIFIDRDSLHGSNLALLDAPRIAPRDTAPTPPSAWHLRLDHAEIASLSADYHDRRQKIAGGLKDLFARLDRQSDGTSVFHLRTGEGETSVRNMELHSVALRLDGTAGAAAVRLDSLLFTAGGFRLAAQGTVPLDTTGRIAVAMRLTGEVQPLYGALQPAMNLPLIRFTGPLVASIHATGTRRSPEAAIEMTLPAVNYSHADVGPGRLRARWSGGTAYLDTLSLPVFNGEIAARGTVVMKPRLKAEATLNVRQVNLASVLSAIGRQVSPFGGELNGGVGLRISEPDPRQWKADAGFELTNFMFESRKLDDLTLRVFADSGTVLAHLLQGDNRMDAHLAMGPESALSGGFALNLPSLKEIGEMLRGSNLEGSLAARGTLEGNLRQPVMQATLIGTGIRYRNFPVDSLTADVRAAGRSVVIRNASIAGTWSRSGAGDAPFGLDSLRGTLAYRGTLSGTPKDLKGRFVMLASGMAYERYHLDSLRLAASIDGSTVRLEEALVRNDTLALRLTGAYDLAARDGELQGGLQPTSMLQAGGSGGRQGGRIDAAARLLEGGLRGHIQLDDVDLASVLSLVQDSVRVGGRASINAEIGGDKKNPDADFTLLVRDPVYADFRLDSVFVKGGLHNGLAAIQTMSLGGQGQSLQGKASVRLVRDSAGMLTVGERSATSGSIETKSLNLHSIQSMIKTNKGLSGTASLVLRWDGTVGSPSLHGTLAIDTLHAVPNERVGPIAFSMRGSVDGRTFVVDTASGTLLNRPFSLRGKLTAESLSQFAADMAFRMADSSLISGKGTISRDRYDLNVLIDRFDLAVAQPFVPSMKRLEGVLNGKIRLAGSPQAPRTQGTLDVSRLTVHPALLDSPLTGGLVKVRFDGNTVHVDSVFIRSAAGGSLLTTGTLALVNNKPEQMNLKTVIDKLSLSSEDNFSARVDSAVISVTNKGGQMMVDGDIDLGESRLTRNVDPGMIFSGNPKVQRVQAPTTPASSAAAEGTLLNLRIHRSDSVWIDNNLARMRFDIEMAVRGSTGKPIPAGKVSIPEGKIIYLDRDFTVKQGDIYFADPNKINPEIHFLAESQVEDYQGMNASTYVVTFSAQGLMNQLTIELTSDPVLDKPDIIALLTLGATRNELSGGGTQGSSTGSVVADRAKQLASEKLGSTVGNAAGKLLGLDQVTLTGNIFNPSEGGGPELMVSKRVSKKTKVTYSSNVGHMNDQSIRLDYELTKIWSLSGETTEGGNSQFGIQYKITFP